MRFREIVISFDWILTGAAFLLVVFGLTMLLSTGPDDQLLSPRFLRQLASFCLGIIAYVVISIFPYHFLRRYAVIIYAVGLAGLIIVSQTGLVIRGTTSRLEFMGMQMQPSEFMKIALIIILAWLFARRYPTNPTTLVSSALLAGLTVLLIALEPDIGVATLMILVWAAIVVFVGTSWRIIALLGLFGFFGFLAAWQWLFAAYQKARLIIFLDPASDPLGAGYNVVQSIVALGSGHFFGRGLGHGPQSQLKFLPEQHTDFILASIGEELGFVGVALVVVLYVLLLRRIIQIARITRDPFGQYLAVGVFSLLLLSFFVSAGMNMGLLPVTGIPLPLLSYGGSNLISTIILLAIVQSVHLYNKWVRQPPEEIAHF
ncbi:MAG: FtsW/RodA/SpoVE family cell cycle protein [bacterium]